ncbi:MAG TPA: hypothetical protein VEL74_09475 [Thermoanaerobaculia bacterium]|nr:hypothetical protein [Thermoanaerobaculia bacterium]
MIDDPEQDETEERGQPEGLDPLDAAPFSADEKLPGSEEIFETYFASWLAAEDLHRHDEEGMRPDVEDGLTSGLPARELSPLTDKGRTIIDEQIRGMVAAAAEDWQGLLSTAGDPSLEWIDAFDRRFGRAEVADIIADADPADDSSDLVVLACELGAVLGEVLRREAPGLEWLHDSPAWTSALYDPRQGRRFNVFHWGIRKFSEDGVDDPLRSKVLRCVGLVRYGA